jgi:hypothetical protein
MPQAPSNVPTAVCRVLSSQIYKLWKRLKSIYCGFTLYEIVGRDLDSFKIADSFIVTRGIQSTDVGMPSVGIARSEGETSQSSGRSVY